MRSETSSCQTCSASPRHEVMCAVIASIDMAVVYQARRAERVESARMNRTVEHGDGVAWLARAPLPADQAIVTSLPDASEVPELGDTWATWFVDVVALAC